jgi:carbon storage regulator
MLVLTRKPEQSLLLGDTITVTVLAIEGDRVKLGIKAPRDIAVLREEIHAQLHAANKAAAQVAPAQVRNIAEVLRRRSTPTNS